MKYILYIILTIILFSELGFSQVAIIANKSVELEEIDKNQLLDYYSLEIKLWDDGEPIMIFDLKIKNDVRKAFFEFLGKSSSRMKSVWMKKMLLGEGDPPEPLESEQDMLERIVDTPGSIGFINMDLVTDEVKLLRIINDEN